MAKNRGGRPKSEPTPQIITLAYNLCLMMADNKKIAELCGISTTTFDRWMQDYPEFSGAIREARDICNSKTVRAMYDKAIGYDYIERTYEHQTLTDAEGLTLLDENGNARTARVLVKEVHKHQPPDVPAAKFFLYNRTKTLDPADQWNDKQHLDLSSKDGSMTPKAAQIQAGIGAEEAMSLYMQFIKDSQK